MFMRKRLLNAAAAAALSTAGATGAYAIDNTPSAESMTDPKIGPAHDQTAEALYTHSLIEVEADNIDWSHAKPISLSLAFHVEAHVSKKKWDISQTYVLVGLAPIQSAGVTGACCGSFDPDDLSPYNYAHMMVEIPSSVDNINRDVWWPLQLDGTEQGMPVAARNACRNLRKALEQQGMKQDEIFGQDRNTSLSYEFRFLAAVSYAKATGSQSFFWKQSQPTSREIGVLCKKRDGYKITVNPNVKPDTNDLAASFQVNQAALAISPKPYAGKCPAEIHLNPTIEATGKGTVKYHFVDQLGNHSQTFQVKFDKHDVKFLDHVIEIDKKGKPKGLGFAAAQAQGGDFGLIAPNNPDLVQGYFQLEVLSPHKKLSNLADYSVKCTNITAGDDLLAPPDVVNPGVVDGGLVGGLPDLFIDSVQESPAVPYKIFVKITNQGNVASTPTNLKAIRWTGNLSTTRGTLVPAIQPGQSQVILANLSGTIAGATQLFLSVDDPNRISEQNEGNNEFQVK